MKNISWSQFETNQQAKDISFESFCFQIAYILYKDYGLFENYYNTPGSEFYLVLHTDCKHLNLKAGDEIGWQAKWWFNSEDNSSLDADHKQKLIENFTTTLKGHPNINKWIICTPGAFVEREFKKLVVELKKLSPKTEFVHWSKSTFMNFQTEMFEEFNTVFNHYFNSNFVGFAFLKQYSQRRVDDLSKKFDTDLYTPSHYDEEILFLLDYKRIFAELEIQIKYLQDDIDRIEEDNLFTKGDYKSFTQEYIQKAYELLRLCVNTSKQVIEIISSKLTIEKSKKLSSVLQNYLDQYGKLADFLNKKLRSKEHLIAEEVPERHFEDWNHTHYVISSINKIQARLITSKDEEKNGNTILDLVELIFQKDLHILSSAGYGKTNIACNICLSLLEKGIPCLLILGSNFRKIEIPQTIILEQLGLKLKYEFKDFLQALNTLGLTKGVKIPIIIDGLNESTPYDAIWKSNIKDIIRDISDLEYVILVTTCRDRYIESIFEETDVSHIRNTKTLVGLSSKVRGTAIKKYFKKYNIVPSSWNFNKDLFQNPLLLKIFSEVNEGKNGIHISLSNIFSSIDSYTDIIENRASIKNSKVDPIIKQRIKSRIEDFCRLLWTSNTREISLSAFHQLIDPESSSLTGSLTEKLLDEGLCFQKNLTAENETVQFTYDLVGGYSIASKVLLKSASSASDVVVKLDKQEIEKKLFTKESEHPLRQDILMSLLHLVPVKFGTNLFELFENEVVFEECSNSIDYYVGNVEGQRKLLEHISIRKKGGKSLKLLLEKLFENIFKKEVHGLGSFTVKVLKNLNQAEVDIFWSELIRKNTEDVYLILFNIQKSYLRNKFSERIEEQDLLFAFLSTTSSDKGIRSLATENLFLIAKAHPNKFIELVRAILFFNDLGSIESVIAAMCGAVLSLKDKPFTEACLKFICEEFLPSLKTTHVCIQDYIQTISEFAEINFKVNLSKEIAFDKSNFKVVKDKSVIDFLKPEHSRHFPYMFGLDLYDFKKYQIAGIETDRYEKRKTYNKTDCLAIISTAMKSKGYSDEYFEAVNKDFQSDNRYKYSRGSSDSLTLYSEKYLWQSYHEFVGYLVLSRKLKSKDKNRYRNDYNFFDPTFPRLPQRFQLITECFFPTESNDIQEWINSEKENYIDDFLLHNLFTNSEWILLSATVNQAGNGNDTRFNLSLYSFLIPSNRIPDLQRRTNERGYYDSSISFHNIFAGEIPWSKFVNSTEESYYEENLELITTKYDYSWTSWTNNRYKNPYFKFLNPKLSNSLKLNFNVSDLSFYDVEGNQVTKIVWVEGSELYYIKKSVMEELIAKSNLELVWFQFISKYGEFGKHEERTLNPSYKDLRKLFIYSSVKAN